MEAEQSVRPDLQNEDIHERIADKIFGPEDDEPEDEESPEPEQVAAEDEIDAEEGEDSPEEIEASEDDSDAPAVVEIEIDGEVLEVPEKYKDYFLRQQDYTQKTQQIAEERKTLEIIREQAQEQAKQFEFAQSVWDDVLKANQYQQLADQYHEHLKTNIDSLSSTDIEKIRFAIEEARGEANKIASEVQAKQQEFQQAQQQSLPELLKKGTEVLRSKIPNWGEQSQKQVRDYALGAGFTEAEISNVVDPRQVEILWKAAQYDSLKKGAAPAVKKVQNAPAIKPKSRNPMPDDVKRKLNMRKKLKSSKDASEKANLIREDIADRLGL